MDLILQNIPKEFAERLLKTGYAELAFRNGKKQFEKYLKAAVKIAERSKTRALNPEVMSKLDVALACANLVATVVSTVIICGKLNEMSGRLDEIRKGLENIKDIQVKTTVLQSNARLTEEYKLNARTLEKGGQVSKEELLTFIRECNRNINTLYSIRNDVDLDVVLGEIFVLLPMMCSYISMYYRTYYSTDEGTNVLHGDWMNTLDILASDECMNQIQDYLFIDKGLTNREVNEYLCSQRYIILQSKQNIEQMLQDLEACDGVEGYEDVMQWSRQYVLQQAKSNQKTFAAKYGEEKAQSIMEQALQSIYG